MNCFIFSLFYHLVILMTNIIIKASQTSKYRFVCFVQTCRATVNLLELHWKFSQGQKNEEMTGANRVFIIIICKEFRVFRIIRPKVIKFRYLCYEILFKEVTIFNGHNWTVFIWTYKLRYSTQFSDFENSTVKTKH